MLTEQELRAIVSDVLAGLGYNASSASAPVATPAEAPVPATRAFPWKNPEAMKEMVSATPARIPIGRAGARYDTDAWLKFRMDHAAARDAIFDEVGPEFVQRLGAVEVTTLVTDPHKYLLRPDLGRRLSPESVELVNAKCPKGARIQIVVADGLSGTAVQANANDFIRAFADGCKVEGLSLAPTPIFVRKGRVAIMDHIGELLQPDLIVELVGERPGLVTAESMSAYFCYRPNLKSIESDRTLISNIHKGGIPAVEAGAHAAKLAARILAAGVSGVKLGL